jgi:gamma-glutamylcyclotransferase (GGCT)/AIG2-like uncharacterized protein YtfP
VQAVRSSTTGDRPDGHEADGNLFVYGTLLLPAVIEALIGRVPDRLPAILPGYRRFRVSGEVFPAIAPEPAARVHGLVYSGLDHGERMILDAFEGSIYTRRRVRARTCAQQIVIADAYVLDEAHMRLAHRAPAWSPEEFATRSGASFVRMCTEFRIRWRAAGPRDG